MKALKKTKKPSKKNISRQTIKDTAELFADLHGDIIEALLTDGAHHKQWFLEQMLAKLGHDVVAQERMYGFERGIAP
jgi:hypothetical protein